MRNVILYIATSLDGYIARANGQVDWLDAIPNPNQLDYGYQAFLTTIDTTLIGNNTYQTILGFGGPFPYPDTTNYVFSRSEQPAAPYVKYVTGEPSRVCSVIENDDWQVDLANWRWTTKYGSDQCGFN